MVAEDVEQLELVRNPFSFLKIGWPHVSIYDRQAEVIESVRDNKITVVPAGNMLGKDFISGFIIVWYFLSRQPCRIVTTSAKDDHLDVLWSEMRNFIRTCSFPLLAEQGGPLVVNQRDLTRIGDEVSYVKGMVASDQSLAAMGGHHAKYTLFVADEASSVRNEYWDIVQGWMKKALIIGNTWPCQNFFKHMIKGRPGGEDKGGDILSPSGDGSLYRKVIHIKAEHSPNVRLGLAEVAAGQHPSHRVIVPGVKTYLEYLENRKLWDPIHQSVALDAEFYEGKDAMLYPKEWLTRAVEYASLLTKSQRLRSGKYMGVDSAMGGDNSAWTIVDEYGIVEQLSLKTFDTTKVVDVTLGYIRSYKMDPENVLFDMGGGGKQHVDYLRKLGYPVRCIAFNETPTEPVKPRTMSTGAKEQVAEMKAVYKNRRAEMYGLLRTLIDPNRPFEPEHEAMMRKAHGITMRPEKPLPKAFGLPSNLTALHAQLAPLPLWYDEGKLYLPPKNKKPDKTNDDGKTLTLKQLLGCSPDEADSLVLAVFGLLVRPRKRVLGAL